MLKFLFRNPTVDFGAFELSRRIQEPRPAILKEVNALQKIGLIKKKR